MTASTQPPLALPQNEHHHRSPRGYCAPISRVISPKSLCHDHLLVGQRSISKIITTAAAAATPTTAAAGAHELQPEELVYVRLETIGGSIGNLSTLAINERLLVGVLGQLFELKESADLGRGDELGGSGGKSSKSALARDVWAQISDPAQGQAVRQARRCREALEKLICRLVYPTCHFRRKDISALVRPPCREDCLLARDLYCPSLDWSKLNQALGRALNLTLGATVSPLGVEAQGGEPIAAEAHNWSHLSTSGAQLNSSSIHLYWPHEHSIRRCESLPPLRPVQMSKWHRLSAAHQALSNDLSENKPAKHAHKLDHADAADGLRWPTCSNAHITVTSAKLKKMFDCIPGDEKIDYEYLGRVNQTRSGLGCQHWLSQHPHQHST